MMQPPALVRQVDRGQVAEATGVLARTTGPARGRPDPRHPQAQAAGRQPRDHGLAGVVAVAHEDPDVGTLADGQGLVQQGPHRRHRGPRRARAAHRPVGPGPGRRLQATVDGIGTVLVQIQDGQDLQLLAPGHPPLAPVPTPADPGQLTPAFGQEGAVPNRARSCA